MGASSTSTYPHGNYLKLLSFACFASRGRRSPGSQARGAGSPVQAGKASAGFNRAEHRVARPEQDVCSASASALPDPPGRGAPGQLGWCQGSDSTPPNSRPGAASKLCPPGLNAFTAVPVPHPARRHRSLCSGAPGRAEKGAMKPPSRGTQHHPNAAKT